MEVWKSINGYEGLYEVSDCGNVKALERHVESGKCHRTWKEHLMRTAVDHKGYLRTALSKDGHSKTYKIHRLVAEAFLPNPNNLEQVNHIDGNKQNNSVDNLEWCNQSENLKHACRMGLKLCNGENNPAAKLTCADVNWIREHYKERDPFYSCSALGKKFGVHRKTIGRIVNGEYWKGGDADVKRSKAL